MKLLRNGVRKPNSRITARYASRVGSCGQRVTGFRYSVPMGFSDVLNTHNSGIMQNRVITSVARSESPRSMILLFRWSHSFIRL